MSTRWWAPAGAHIGPDEADLALLAPGGEARYDLGAAMFALHRTGAAACEVVAASPIPDAMTLITNLATARMAVAPPLVECISKSLGDGAYAGLLVRDVSDDAERAAVDLFNAAVSKGVAPPLAAQRVGYVYGVDSAGLGTYRTLACTPAANPVALADAADRALFGFVEKLCTAEVDENPTVEISKAPTHYNEQEPRDSGGKWTTTKDPVLDNFMLQVREMEEAEEAEQKAKTEAKPIKTIKTIKTIRTVPKAQVKAEVKVKTNATTKAKVMASYNISAKSLVNLKPDEAQTEVPEKKLYSAGDRWNDEEDYPTVRTGSLGYVLNKGDYLALLPLMSRTKNGKVVFRAGALSDLGAAPEVHGSPEHIAQIVGHGVQQMVQRDDEGLRNAPTKKVSDEDLLGVPLDKRKEALLDYAKDLVEETVAKWNLKPKGDYRAFVNQEARMAVDRGLRNTDDTGYVLVYKPSLDDSDFIPSHGLINEIMVDSEYIRAHINPGRHQQILVDPNQLFEVIGKHTSYDATTGTRIETHVVHPIDDDEVAKADVRDEPRDDHGRWTSTKTQLGLPHDYWDKFFTETEPVTEARPKPIKQIKSIKSIKPIKPVVQAQSHAKVKATVHAQASTMSAKINAVMNAALQAHVSEDEDKDEDGLITDDGTYHVLSPEKFTELCKLAGVHPKFFTFSSSQAPAEIPFLTDKVDDWWADNNGMLQEIKGTDLAEGMLNGTLLAINDADSESNGVGSYDFPVFTRRIHPDDDEGWEQLALDMAKYLDKNPESVHLSAMPENHNDPNLLTVFTNTKAPPPVTLVIQDDGRHPDDADGLYLAGQMKWRDLPAKYTHKMVGREMVNPTVNIYRLVDNRYNGHDE